MEGLASMQRASFSLGSNIMLLSPRSASQDYARGAMKRHGLNMWRLGWPATDYSLWIGVAAWFMMRKRLRGSRRDRSYTLLTERVRAHQYADPRLATASDSRCRRNPHGRRYSRLAHR